MTCPGDHHTCYRDCCRDDQFCNDHEERCTGCGTLESLCGTDKMPVQCKYYCLVKNDHQTQTDPLANPGLAIAGIVCMVIVALLIIALILYGIVKRPQWLVNCFRGLINYSGKNSLCLQCAKALDSPVAMSSGVTVIGCGPDVSLKSEASKYGSSGAGTVDVDNANQPLLRTSDDCHSADHNGCTRTLGVTTHTGSEDSLPSPSVPESVNGTARDVHEVSRSAETVPIVVQTRHLQRGISGAGNNDNEWANFGRPGERSSADTAYRPQQTNAQHATQVPYCRNDNSSDNGRTAGNSQHQQPADRNTLSAEESPHDIHVGAHPSTTINIHNNVNNFIDHNGTPSSGHSVAANTPAPHRPGNQASNSASPFQINGQGAVLRSANHCGSEGRGTFNPNASAPHTPHDQGQGRCEGHHAGECRDARLNGICPTQPAPGEEDGVVHLAICQNSVPRNSRLEQSHEPSNE